MARHSTIQLQLYEYLQKELDDHARLEVEAHLRVCDACRKDLDELRVTLAEVPRPAGDPAGEMPPEFWQHLMADVERSITTHDQPTASPWRGFVEQFTSLPIFQPRVALGMAIVLVMMIGGVVTRELMIRRSAEPSGEAPFQAARVDSVPPADANSRMSGYLRRSKNLLVGITNMKPAPFGQVDLSTERRASRELVQEARFLKQLPLDNRSARLISDLEKIQIELANLEGTYNDSGVELIRHGIRRENLLFKVRVTETLYDRASFIQTSYAR